MEDDSGNWAIGLMQTCDIVGNQNFKLLLIMYGGLWGKPIMMTPCMGGMGRRSCRRQEQRGATGRTTFKEDDDDDVDVDDHDDHDKVPPWCP